MKKTILAIVAFGAIGFVQVTNACGAIAFNPNTHSWGRATGYPDLGDAMNNAVNDCNDGCGVYAWTCSDAVTAIVFDSGSDWATSTGATAGDAVSNAQSICSGNCDGYVTAGSN